jgi:hypothetical protein
MATKKIVPVKNYGEKYHFLSFGRLIKNSLIFVENNKNVKRYTLDSKI